MNIYSDDVKKILKESKNIAYYNLNNIISLKHLLNATLSTNNHISQMLSSYNIKQVTITRGKKNDCEPVFSSNIKDLLDKTIYYCKEKDMLPITADNLFLIILKEKNNYIYKYLNNLINVNNIIDILDNNNTLLVTNKLGIDFTNLNINKNFDKVIGREEEINRIINILKRKNKNNPVLVGDAGVGKTAIIEELSRRICNKEVPCFLHNNKIISINTSSIIAGTKYRGEFEEKLTSIINEIVKEKNIILFIDEIHTIVGAGGAEGAIDASNILKPYLARGMFKLIGATTLKEYNKIIQKDDALDRRFQKVYIKEPNSDEMLLILKKIKKDYEIYHDVKISDNIIKQIAMLSNKYIHNKKNPDKSIDLLDEVCAKESINSFENKQVFYNKRIAYYKEKTKYYIKSNNIEKATYYKDKELLYQDKIDKYVHKKYITNVKISTLKNVLEEKVNQKIIEFENSNNYFDNIKKILKNSVYGQDKAINSFINIIKVNKFKATTLPIRVHIKGPINTGKHLLINEYNKFINKKVIIINATEYDKETTNNKLLGSAPGYVGYDNENIFSPISDNPDATIIINDSNKMNNQLKNIFDTIIAYGKITNNKNEEIVFNNNLIFFVENEKDFISSSIGYIKNENIGANNVDYNIIQFNKLSKNDTIKIIKNEIQKYFLEHNIKNKINANDYNNIYDNCKNNNVKISVEKYLEKFLVNV